jgi:hypothetical protein
MQKAEWMHLSICGNVKGDCMVVCNALHIWGPCAEKNRSFRIYQQQLFCYLVEWQWVV